MLCTSRKRARISYTITLIFPATNHTQAREETSTIIKGAILNPFGMLKILQMSSFFRKV